MAQPIVARTPQQVKSQIHTDMINAQLYNGTTTPGQRGAIVGALNTYTGDGVDRRMVIAWLFDKGLTVSSKELDEGEWCALDKWVGYWKDDIEGWCVAPTFPLECALVKTEAIKVYKAAKAEFRTPDIYPDYMVADAVANLGGVVTVVYGPDGKPLLGGAVAPTDYLKREPLLPRRARKGK